MPGHKPVGWHATPGRRAAHLGPDSSPPASTLPGAPLASAGQRLPTGRWLPSFQAGELTVAAGVCLCAIAVADDAAVRGSSWSSILFWVALVGMFAVFAFRLLGNRVSRREQVYLVVLLGVALYLVKVLRSPEGFTFTDEFMQMRTAIDILRTGHLFGFNPLLPISAQYPGMQLATIGLMEVSGLGLFPAGLAVIGVGHLLAIVCLFLIFERVTGSPRLAALASLAYMANPHYLYWDSQFSYESFALPLELAALLLAVEFASAKDQTVRSGLRSGTTGLSWLLAAGLVFIAAVPSHHVSVYIFLGLLSGWWLISWVLRRLWKRPTLGGTWALPAVGAVAGLVWLRWVAPDTPHYLGSQLGNAVASVLRVLTGGLASRHLFVSGGVVAPLWQRLAGLGSAVLLVVTLPFGLVMAWRRHRRNALMFTLAIAAVVYPATLLLHLAPQGVETGDRAVEFVFLGLAPVVALVFGWLARDGRLGILRRSLMAGALSGVFVGGAVLGWTFYLQLPVPPSAPGVPAVTNPQALAAANWMLAHLGPHQVVATDGTDALLVGSVGQQNPLTSAAGPVPAWPILIYSQLGQLGDFTLQRGHVKFIEVNQRLTKGLPQGANFFGQGAPTQTRVLPQAALSKFAKLGFLSRIYDSGNIQIYEVTRAVP